MNLTNKKITVTGGSGFLGQAVVAELKKQNCNNIFIPRSKDYDLRKEQDIKNMFNDHPSNIIIHLAASCGGIGFNRDNPATLFYDNIMMGTQLMEVSRQMNVEKFVAIGTICAYPNLTPVPFKEEDLWKGYPEVTNAPYGLAKKMMLVQSQAYRQQYDFNSIYLLPVNLYGPNDNFDLEKSHVIPAMIRKVHEAIQNNQNQITLWGDGSASREFLYVEDAAKAIVKATQSYDKSEPVNIGASCEITIKELAELICKLMNFKGQIIWDTTKPNGQPRRCLDTSKAQEEFDFKANTSLEEGLKKTIQWFQESSLK